MFINVNGRLGKDAETITTKNGSTLVRYSLGVDEYNYETKQRETRWLNVLDSTDFTKKKLEFLKKGTMINLIGDYKPSLSQYNGETRLDNTTNAYAWSFVSVGKNSDKTQSDNNVSPTPSTVSPRTEETSKAPSAAPNISMGTFKQPTPTVTENNGYSTEDLPF